MTALRLAGIETPLCSRFEAVKFQVLYIGEPTKRSGRKDTSYLKCPPSLTGIAHLTWTHDNITIVYTKEAETADAYIERFAHEHASRYRVTVATSDGLEQIIIRGAGCILLSAREFEQEVKEKNRQLQAEYDSRKDHGKVYLRDQMPSQVLDGSLEEQQ